MTLPAWRSPKHPTWQGPATGKCQSCGHPCTRSLYGYKCFLCNFNSFARKFQGFGFTVHPKDPEAMTQTRLRMVISAAAYAYEIDNQPLVSDAIFDHMAKRISLHVDTNRPIMDRWFREEFSPDTGQWIHRHPDLDGIRRILAMLRSGEMKIGCGYG